MKTAITREAEWMVLPNTLPNSRTLISGLGQEGGTPSLLRYYGISELSIAWRRTHESICPPGNCRLEARGKVRGQSSILLPRFGSRVDRKWFALLCHRSQGHRQDRHLRIPAQAAGDQDLRPEAHLQELSVQRALRSTERRVQPPQSVHHVVEVRDLLLCRANDVAQ